MASTPSSTKLRERIETTARAFLSAFEEGGVQDDPSIINREVTADCTRRLLPASLPQAFGLSADALIDKMMIQEAYAKEIKVLSYGNSTMSNLLIDTEARQAAFTSHADVYPKNGESFSFEQAWFLYFNEDGSKVTKVVEFCDKDTVLRIVKTAA